MRRADLFRIKVQALSFPDPNLLDGFFFMSLALSRAFRHSIYALSTRLIRFSPWNQYHAHTGVECAVRAIAAGAPVTNAGMYSLSFESKNMSVS
jgi:hypothetical protein